MIPVLQTNTGGRGNCMAACLASILECSIDDAPDYRAAGDEWQNALNTWLSKHHDLVLIENERFLTDRIVPRDWHLINYGDASGGHSIVGYFGRPMWDPSTGRMVGTTSREPYSYGILVRVDDDLRATWERTWNECPCPRCLRGEG